MRPQLIMILLYEGILSSRGSLQLGVDVLVLHSLKDDHSCGARWAAPGVYPQRALVHVHMVRMFDPHYVGRARVCMRMHVHACAPR